MTDEKDAATPSQLPKADAIATKAVNKAGQLQSKTPSALGGKKNTKSEEKPSGGFDSTSVPRAAPGYTVKITFHGAEDLPIADLNAMSSDPYIVAVLQHRLPTRHKQDPPLVLRTPTIRRTTQPRWDCDWILCNVPASGFRLKCRLFDEDPGNHDDRLGGVHIPVSGLREDWKGIHEQRFEIRKRKGSKRAYMMQACVAFFTRKNYSGGQLIVSVQVLGRTQDDSGGKIYTLGPCAWTQHFSPMIGRMTGVKNPGQPQKDGKSEQQSYNFQANQMQLRGPVPDKLYHRYVQFKPFVAGMFNGKTLKGRILNRALHHQHRRIYSYNKSTVYGSFPEPCKEMTKQFLDSVHWDEGGRVFTYVLTLDGQMRFTETGPEFGIDLLSKHTMHSNVNIYIAFSGEFFIRRLSNSAATDPKEGGDPTDDTVQKESAKHHRGVGEYQLIIDNDSGTYRPNEETLDLLKEFLEKNLPGLSILALSCNADEKKLSKMKEEQRERKKNEGPNIALAQAPGSDTSSISSSDEEQLDAAAGQPKQRHGARKALHAVSEPQEAVLGWAQKQGSKSDLTKDFSAEKSNNANGHATASNGGPAKAQALDESNKENHGQGSGEGVNLQVSADTAQKGTMDEKQQDAERGAANEPTHAESGATETVGSGKASG